MLLSALSPFSQNRRRPSSTASTVIGLSGGISRGGKNGGMSISRAVVPGGLGLFTTGSGLQPSDIKNTKARTAQVKLKGS